MGYAITKHRGEVCYDVMEFVVDKIADIENLPSNKAEEGSRIICSAGSTAFCIENKGAYILGTDGKWVQI